MIRHVGELDARAKISEVRMVRAVLVVVAAMMASVAAFATTVHAAPSSPGDVELGPGIYIESPAPIPQLAAKTSKPTGLFANGGCAVGADGDIDSCISYQGGNRRVAGDFYRLDNQWLWATKARVYISTSQHGLVYKYTADLDHYGHYPVAYQSVSGSGNAATYVELRDGSDTVQAGAWSPNVSW